MQMNIWIESEWTGRNMYLRTAKKYYYTFCIDHCTRRIAIHSYLKKAPWKTFFDAAFFFSKRLGKLFVLVAPYTIYMGSSSPHITCWFNKSSIAQMVNVFVAHEWYSYTDMKRRHLERMMRWCPNVHVVFIPEPCLIQWLIFVQWKTFLASTKKLNENKKANIRKWKRAWLFQHFCVI